MLKVLLTTLNAKYIHSSLALRYLKTYNQVEPGFDIVLKEYTINERLQDIIADIYCEKPDIVAFSCYIWNIRPILDICADYRKICPDSIIILGGPEVSYDAGSVLKENRAVDYIIRGEGEITLKELLLAIKNGEDTRNIAGLTFRSGKEIQNNDNRELIRELDIIPFPYTDLDEMNNRVVYYESSRGCPFNCSYCLSSTTRSVRFFSMERVKKDLNLLLSQRVREIKFVDRTFNCDEKRAMEIMLFLINNNTGNKFHFEICADLISDEMLDFLSTVPADLFNFEIGIQSSCQAALAAVNRKTNWDRLSSNINKLKSFNNIHIHLDLIAGLPIESYDEFSNSFNMVYNFNADVIQLGFLKLLKGSQLREETEKYGYQFQDYPPYQVLSNHAMPYENILMLKNIEDILDKYYNSGIVKNSLRYVINTIYNDNPFIFYEEFANYWQQNNLFSIGHKRETLYTHFINFIKLYYPAKKEFLNELLKYDYLLNHRSNLPAGLLSNNPEDINDKLYSLLNNPEFLNKNLNDIDFKSRRELRKNLHLEYFTVDPHTFMNLDKPVYILFVYNAQKKRVYKTIRIEEDLYIQTGDF